MAKKSEYVAWCDNEAAKIRKRYGFSYTDPLDPYTLAESLGIKVIEPHDISGISSQDIEILRSIGTDWSGLSFPLPDNRKIVILNPFHEQPRKMITLMEEICHLIYVHKPQTKVRLFGYQKINFSDFSKKDEKIAYRVAASVLVPYKALESLIMQRKNIGEISLYFGVSPELVEFRLKITGLFQRYKVMQKLRDLLPSS
jgi:hypothetical protein